MVNCITWIFYGRNQVAGIAAERTLNYIHENEGIYFPLNGIAVLSVKGYGGTIVDQKPKTIPTQNHILKLKDTIKKSLPLLNRNNCEIIDNYNFVDHSVNYPTISFRYTNNIPYYMVQRIHIFAGENSITFTWKGFWLFTRWFTLNEYISGSA